MSHSGNISSEVRMLKGSSREMLLAKTFFVPVCQSITVSVHVLQAQVSELESDLTAATEKLSATQDPMVHMYMVSLLC